MDPVTLCECLSPQELRVKDRIDGKVDRFRKTHERSFRMLERFDGKKPVIDIERALYFTQSMKETEGQPLVLRWAKALRKIAENITVTVEDDMLLLGRAGSRGGRRRAEDHRLQGRRRGPRLGGRFGDLPRAQLRRAAQRRRHHV